MLTKSVEYAIKSLIHIYRSDKVINVIDISNELETPRNYTSKILKTLSTKGYITSQRGPGGGFSILDYNKTLSDLIIDIDGQLLVNENKCVMGLSECKDSRPCPLHKHFCSIKKDIEKLYSLKIEDICNNDDFLL